MGEAETGKDLLQALELSLERDYFDVQICDQHH